MTLSRRDFFKLCGVTAAGIFATRYIDLFPKQMVNVEAQTSPWAFSVDTDIPAIHIALLHTGRILYGIGSGWNYIRQSGPFEARVRDIAGTNERTIVMNEDLFCTGQTTLADGTLLFAGGTLLYDTNPDNCNGDWHGESCTYEFNPTTETFTKRQDMLHGRWYPTLVTLPDGRVWCYNGYDEYGINNRLVERYDPVSKTWTRIPAGGTLTYTVGLNQTCGDTTPTYSGAGPTTSFYPRAHLMPSGLVVMNGFRMEIRSWNPATGAWASHGSSGVFRYYGTSFLLPLQNTTAERGRILVCSGAPSSGGIGTTNAQILDFNTGNPTIRTIAPSAFGRVYPSPVMLPNGKCMVFGGTNQGFNNPVLVPEVFDPITETWQTLPASTVPRYYHSTALLLPDGRVWVAGGTRVSSTFEPRTEFFSPSYMTQTRPVISGTPTVGAYGGTIIIPTPSPTTVTSVSLLRLMNTTHHYDANQRLVWLQIISRETSSVTVSAPINPNIAPPGYYLIHVLNSSLTPSAGGIIKIPGTSTAPPPDTTRPNVAITAPASGASIPRNTNFTVTGTASDNVGVRDVRVRVDSGTYQLATTSNAWANWSRVLSIATPGLHRLTANARDAAGNYRTTGRDVNIT